MQNYCGRVGGMYYLYRQNNSRGYFKPPAIHVFIEAENEDEANQKFLSIPGCYFDPDCHFDCECCGTRWSNEYLETLSLEEVYARLKQETVWITQQMYEGVAKGYILHRDAEPEII